MADSLNIYLDVEDIVSLTRGCYGLFVHCFQNKIKKKCVKFKKIIIDYWIV